MLFQISDFEFLQCRGLILDYLAAYKSQPSKRPHLQLIWTVSRRTMNKMKPSTRCLLDLETIMEDEDADGTDESDDAAPFDRSVRSSWGNHDSYLTEGIKTSNKKMFGKLRNHWWV